MVSEKKHILFVCTGNLCRSVIAEHLLRAMAKRRGLALEVRSRGISAPFGKAPPFETLYAGNLLGLDVAGHQSMPITASDVQWADEILVMEPWQKGSVETLGAGGKTSGLWVWLGDGSDSIEDPYGKSLEHHVIIGEKLRKAIANWLDRRIKDKEER